MSAMPGSGATATEDEKKPMEQRTNLKLKRRCGTGDKSYSSALAKSRSNFQKKKANAKDYILVDENEGFGDSEDCYQTPGPCDFSEGIGTDVSKYYEDVAWSYSPMKTNSSKKRKKMSESSKSHEVALVEAVASLEEVKIRGDAFIANCILHLYKKSMDKVFLVLKNDVQRWRFLKNVVG